MLSRLDEELPRDSDHALSGPAAGTHRKTPCDFLGDISANNGEIAAIELKNVRTPCGLCAGPDCIWQKATHYHASTNDFSYVTRQLEITLVIACVRCSTT